MNINDFKKNRNIQDLINNIKKQESSRGEADTRFWKPTLDKEKGTGSATIRFLPRLPSDKHQSDWISRYTHGFKGKGGWYIENCPTTMEGQQSCPVCDVNRALYATDLKSDKDLVGEQKRRLTYICNILVINDPAKPDANGKNFLFEFGPKTFDFIKFKLMPKFEGEESMNPFDPWTGANFKIRAVREDGQWNYNQSQFESPSDLFEGDDQKKMALFAKLHLLHPFQAQESHKPYAELAKRVVDVLGPLAGSGISVLDAIKVGAPDVTPSAPRPQAHQNDTPAPKAAEKPAAPKVETPKAAPAPAQAVSSGDDDLEMFKDLAG